jgi:hypothetical protein
MEERVSRRRRLTTIVWFVVPGDVVAVGGAARAQEHSGSRDAVDPWRHVEIGRPDVS